jgi:thiosulfate dehydrogenase
MMKEYLVGGMIFVVILAVAGGFLSMFYGASPEYIEQVPTAPTEIPTLASLSHMAFVPPDPERAPPPIRDLVLDGYYVLMDTRMHAPRYVSPQTGLACRNCHFEGGRARDSISLVGAATQYPRPPSDPNARGIVTLAQKVQSCFVDNLGGSAPPADSREMQAVEAYLSWISKDLPLYGDIPWLGLAPLSEQQAPDVNRGRQVFASICSQCHGPEGQGGGLAPPLWGSGSFTTGSSMARQPLLASFVLKFMPYRRPSLQPQQASDAAGFVLTQPRRPPGPRMPSASQPPTAVSLTGPGKLPVPESMPYEQVPPEMRPAEQLQKTFEQIIKTGMAQNPGPKSAAPSQ